MINYGQKGCLVINIGVGYSPDFDGEMTFITPIFPVPKNPEYFTCSSIIPNIGTVIDYGFTKKFSLGLAGSYQSELVKSDEDPYTDRITRINLAVRFLKHLIKRHPKFDDYIGLRIGCSYWKDVPLHSSYYQNLNYSPHVSYFITNPNSFVTSVQLLYGLRFYFSDSIGIHFEVGIGSPYLAETGLTFRFKKGKLKAT